MMLETAIIHQTIQLPQTPSAAFKVFTEASAHQSLVDLPCHIEARVGGGFEVGEDMISGQFLEIVPDRKIRLKWRINLYDWPKDHYSLLTIELHESGTGTRVELQQTGIPSRAREFVDKGWHAYYWEPMRKKSRAAS